jgi:hypothetical protein
MSLLSEPPPQTMGDATLPSSPEKARTLGDGEADDDSMIHAESEPVGLVGGEDGDAAAEAAVGEKEGESMASAGEMKKDPSSKASATKPPLDKKMSSPPTVTGVVKKAASGAIGGVKRALGKPLLLSFTRSKLWLLLLLSLSLSRADLRSLVLFRCD